MMGVAFIIEAWTVAEEGDSGWGPLSGQIMSTFKVLEFNCLGTYYIIINYAT